MSFDGSVVEVEHLGEPWTRAVRVKARVIKKHKGEPEGHVTLYTPLDGGLCGVGKELIRAQQTGEAFEFIVYRTTPVSRNLLPTEELATGLCLLLPVEGSPRAIRERR